MRPKNREALVPASGKCRKFSAGATAWLRHITVILNRISTVAFGTEFGRFICVLASQRRRLTAGERLEPGRGDSVAPWITWRRTRMWTPTAWLWSGIHAWARRLSGRERRTRGLRLLFPMIQAK